MDYSSLLSRISSYNEFLKVKELNSILEEFASEKAIKLVNLGGLKEDKIYCGVLGRGKNNILIFGFPHPNEPIGSLSCIELIKLIARNAELKEKFTWYIVPCADPYGARLNEGWFKGKFDLKKQAYEFYRPEANRQTDWAFPINYKGYSFSKPPKNVKALIRLIDRIKPSLIYPIHDAGALSGSYFYLSHSMPQNYFKEVIGLCNRLTIPPDLGNPEGGIMLTRAYKKPFYEALTLESYYAYYKKHGKDPIEELKKLNSGTSSIGYAKQINPALFGIICEVPTLFSNKTVNESVSEADPKEIRRQELKHLNKNREILEKAFRVRHLNKKSPFYRSCRFAYQIIYKMPSAEVAEDTRMTREKITVATEFSKTVGNVYLKTRTLGQVRRLLLDSKQTNETKKLINDIERQINENIGYIKRYSKYYSLPLKKLIQLQLGALFISLKYLF